MNTCSRRAAPVALLAQGNRGSACSLAENGEGQTGVIGGPLGLRVSSAEHVNHALRERGRWTSTGTIWTKPEKTLRQVLHVLDPRLETGAYPRRSTVMTALPRLAEVIHGYQRDSSSKRPGSSIAPALRTRDKTLKPPDPVIGALTMVAPYQSSSVQQGPHSATHARILRRA